MAHEVGETVEREGRWYNVYGKSTPHAGKDLPLLFSYEQPSYASEAEAIAADKQRSQDWHYEELRPVMTGPSLVPEVTPRGVFEDRPSDLSTLSNRLFHVPTSREIGAEKLAERERRGESLAQSYEGAASEREGDLAAMTKLSDTQTAERRDKRPVAKELPPTPSVAGRPFLSPGDGLLNQLQAVMMGVGQMALQAKGLRGSAIGAVAGLKGMMEGWAAGDAERIKAAYTKWKADSDRLIQQHRQAREDWEDLLLDQRQTWDQRLAAGRIRAEIAGNKALAEQMRVGNIDAWLKWNHESEVLELEHERFAKELAHWDATARKDERNFLALEARRAELKAAADARLAERKRMNDLRAPLLQMPTQALKTAKENLAIDNRLREVDQLEQALKVTTAAGVTPAGRDVFDQGAAALAAKFRSDPKLGPAIDTVERIGTALLVGRELALGQTASTMRIREIVSKEAGNILGATQGFWAQELPIYRKQLQQQKSLNADYLSTFKAAARLAGPAMQDRDEDAVILSTEE